MCIRKSTEPTDSNQCTAIEYSQMILKGISQKADKSKRDATILFSMILISSVSAPFLILMPWNFFLSKIMPALLSCLIAIATGYMQLRKPDEKWVLYRTAQRDIEYQIDQYRFENGIYNNSPDKDKILANVISERALQLHYDWIPFAPTSKEMSNIKKGLNKNV